MIKERLGVQAQSNRVTEISQIVLNNVAKLSNLTFVLLFVYLIFEVIKNIEDFGFENLGKALVGVLLFLISLLVFTSHLIDSYQVKKAQLKSQNAFIKKKKKIEGSLEMNDFSKDSQSTGFRIATSLAMKRRKIIVGMTMDYKNMTNFLMWLLMFISLVAYNQIFRAVLLVRLASIDVKTLLRNKVVSKNPVISKIILIWTLMVLVAYLYSLTDLFFDSRDSLPPEYTYDGWEDYWTCTGAVLDNDINNDKSGLESIVNSLLFVVILISSTNIIINIAISILLRNQYMTSFLSKGDASRSSLGGLVSDVCLVWGKHRSEFDISMNKLGSEETQANARKKSTGWSEHVNKEHNIFAYFYYIIYVIDKPDDEWDGVELYVKKSVQANDISFIPINMALSLQG